MIKIDSLPPQAASPLVIPTEILAKNASSFFFFLIFNI